MWSSQGTKYCQIKVIVPFRAGAKRGVSCVPVLTIPARPGQPKAGLRPSRYKYSLWPMPNAESTSAGSRNAFIDLDSIVANADSDCETVTAPQSDEALNTLNVLLTHSYRVMIEKRVKRFIRRARE